MGSKIDKIKALTQIKEHEGKTQIGVLFEEKEGWRNIQASEEVLKEIQREVIRKGNTIGYDLHEGIISNLSLIEKASPYKPVSDHQKQPEGNSDDEVVNIKGKDFVTYKGLLRKAHEKGLESFEILEKKISEDMKMAWCVVRAHVKDGKYFDGIGSSTPENTGTMTQDHPIEMANTRAKGRALRDFLNIGTTMLEELKQQK